MARGPFQGTYQPNARPVVVTAPDALVMINNNTQVVGCPTCNKSFDINKYITGIQVDLSVDSVPGSASISLSVPRHTIDDFYFDNNPVISPMMEVNIYAKGFYLVEGIPQYYPIFWGLITEVNDSYSSGEHTVALHCADILKWWELCRMNMNPSMTAPVPSKFGQTLYGNIFAGMNPFDIIWTLAQQSYGDILVGGGSLSTIAVDSPLATPLFMSALSDIMAYWQVRFQNITKNLLLYGSNGTCVRGDVLQRQTLNSKNVPSNLASRTIATASGGLSGGQTGVFNYDPNGPGVFAFRPNLSNLSVNAWTNEFQTKLELANAAKDCIGYEFFMDVTGDIVFKPPFYNLDVLSNKPLSWIQDIDVIEWDLADSESEVITQLTLGGNAWADIDARPELQKFANVTDYHLLRKYGWRPAQMNSEWMTNVVDMFYYGLDYLDRMNARRHRGTVTIPFRPEMRLGVPVYLASKDQIWYCQGVSHNIEFGGRATTTLTLIARREKFKAPQGIGSLTLTSYTPASTAPTGTAPSPGSSTFTYSGKQLSQGGHFTLKLGDAATLPANPAAFAGSDPSQNPYQPLIIRDPQTGRILGYPNAVMAYVAPYDPELITGQAVAGQNQLNTIGRLPTAAQSKAVQAQQTSAVRQFAQINDDITSGITAKYLTNVSQFGLTTAGLFIYAHDLGSASPGSTGGSNVQGVIGDLVLIRAGNLLTTPVPAATLDEAIANAAGAGATGQVNNATVMIRPVSDDRGFEVIGHYRYGRGVSLSDGQLVVQGGSQNFQAANVAIQVALSGSLTASLTAQAQGLTAITSPYPNPIDAIAQLQPEDLQTSGFTTPSTSGVPGMGGTVSYGNTQTNFASLPVLGSPQQVGVFPSIEVSQLSSGLSLAEMTVIDNVGSMDGADSTQPQCMCLLGRSDLAFINTGYQVQNLNGTATDTTTLPNPNTFSTSGGSPSTSGPQTIGQVTDVATSAEQDAYSAAIQQGNPLNPAVSTSIASLPPDQVETIIDKFLFGLYTALDAPHQAYEQQLRGGIYQAPQPGANGSTSFGPDSALGATAPPFSAAGQFAVGNPLATAQMASSAAANLSQAWSSFGQSLQSTAQLASLTTQIASDQSSLATLQTQLAASPGNSQLQQQITALQQKIAAESLQANQIRSQQMAVPITPVTVPSTAFPASGNTPGTGTF